MVCAPLGGEGAASPSNTMWLGPRPTSTPSFILIHPTVWPQYTNVADRQTDAQTDRRDRQTDNGPVAQANRFTNSRPKIEKLPYLSNGLTDRREIWLGDAYWHVGAYLSYRQLKIRPFKNPIWYTAAVCTILDLKITIYLCRHPFLYWVQCINIATEQ